MTLHGFAPGTERAVLRGRWDNSGRDVRQRRRGMTRYLISFPSTAMDVPDEEIPDVARDGHAVIQEAKDAGV